MLPPCKGCKNKGCGAHHDECLAYQDYLKKLEAAKKTRKEVLDDGRGIYVKDSTARHRNNHMFRTHKR